MTPIVARDDRKPLTPEEHQKRHVELHRAIDELLADWLAHMPDASIDRAIIDLVQWSYKQTLSPHAVEEGA